jgi:hypothetical protein
VARGPGKAEATRVQIEYALLADYAEIVGGKLYVMGGGWDFYRVASEPAQVRLAVAVGLRLEWEETNQPQPVTVRVEHEDGAELARIDGQVNVGRPPNLPPGSTQLAQLAVNLSLNLQQLGGFRVRINAGTGQSALTRTLPFRVVKS